MPRKYITQIYEIASPEEAVALAELGVDNIGSVLLTKEDWKQPAIKETVLAAQSSGAKSTVIPLFNDPETVFRVIDHYRSDIIHFCETLAGYSNAQLDKLLELQVAIRARFPDIKIMRSIPIARKGLAETVPTLQLAKKFEDVSDYFLTDTYISATDFVGITGLPCDWNMAARLVQESKIPVFLAGGISAENACEALIYTKPFGIDSCTLTNKQDQNGKPIRFQKDLGKVLRLISEVRRAEKGS